MITKVGDNRVVVKKVITVKDINEKDVQIYETVTEYGQERVTRELVEIETLLAKKQELLDIQAELLKE